ncbi:hypothetical protein VKT23_014628 [Stygiomarasmius scandens]|uniref:DNA 3'-5' helicase n=1 Tax=Marasmiellus scandens TaxID=2682957 RepID=A0ABR1J2C2_9AGAR
MASPIAFSSNEGRNSLNTIVTKLIPQWSTGLREFQAESIPLILDNHDVFAITATGDGKSALFSVPILVHQEISKNPGLYPKFQVPIRQEPVGIVVTPTKGLANNIVKELEGQFNIAAFAYTRENVAQKVREGEDIDKDIADCRYRIICVDPEHLREPSWIKISDSPKFRANVIFGCAEEAHVIDEWGLDFRPLFRHIGAFFRSRLPSTKSVFAITATMAPGTSQESVCSSLGFSGSKFHFLRRSNECPNVEISVRTLTSALSSRQFPELLPFLNQGRQTIIHVRTIELGYRVFLYLFRNAPQTYNRHHRIRMYSALAPDSYNQRTIELLQTDVRCQIVIATKAFSLGIHANTLQDSICIGTPDTQCELDQCGGRVGRKREMNARRIIFVTPKEMSNAQKRIEATVPEGGKGKLMDLAKAKFITEKTCRVSCINKIYNNPPAETSYLDCIQAKRRLPCDLCHARYDLLDVSVLTFPSSVGANVLAPFNIPTVSTVKRKGRKRLDELKKKEVEKVRGAFDRYEKQVWLEERTRLPHRNIPRCFYLPSEVVDLVASDLLKIGSLDILTDKLKPIDWIFKDSQMAKLFIFILTLGSDIRSSRELTSNAKAKARSRKAQQSSDVESEPEMEAASPKPKPKPKPKSKPDRDLNCVKDQPLPGSRKRPALDEIPTETRLTKRNATMTAAEAKEFYARPTYNIPKQSEPENSNLRRSSRRKA